MTRHLHGSLLVAALALSATAALPSAASAATSQVRARHAAHARIVAHHAYRVGYDRGFRAGQIAEAQQLQTGRSAAVDPSQQGLLGDGGLLGTGLLGGQGVLGTGVLNGQGALGLGILGL